MRSPIPDYLTEALDGVRADRTGAPAQYIPELATADPQRLGLSSPLPTVRSTPGATSTSSSPSSRSPSPSSTRWRFATVASTGSWTRWLSSRRGKPSTSLLGGRVRASPQPDDQRRRDHGPLARRSRELQPGGAPGARRQRSRPSRAVGRRSTSRCTHRRWITPSATSPTAPCSGATASSRKTRRRWSRGKPGSAPCS
jgi:hypothetical protein